MKDQRVTKKTNLALENVKYRTLSSEYFNFSNSCLDKSIKKPYQLFQREIVSLKNISPMPCTLKNKRAIIFHLRQT